MRGSCKGTINCWRDRVKAFVRFEHTPRQPVTSPFKPINRLLKIDRRNGTTYNRLDTVGHKMVN